MYSQFRLSLSVMVLVIAIPSYAASGSTGYRDIDYVRIGGGFIRIVATSNWDDPSSCGGGATNQSVIVLNTDPHYDEVVSSVLAAKFADHQIMFWVSGCATDSGSQYLKGTFIYQK